jgi:hypothetical protein
MKRIKCNKILKSIFTSRTSLLSIECCKKKIQNLSEIFLKNYSISIILYFRKAFGYKIKYLLIFLYISQFNIAVA